MCPESWHDLQRYLRYADRTYQALDAHWRSAIHELSKEEFARMLGQLALSYSLSDQACGNQLRFGFVGYDWYLRFDHQMKQGILSYGIFLPNATDESSRYEVCKYEFSQDGILKGDEGMIPDAMMSIHLRFLAIEVPRFLKSNAHLAITERVHPDNHG